MAVMQSQFTTAMHMARQTTSVHATPFAHLPSGKIRRCCPDRLNSQPKADITAHVAFENDLPISLACATKSFAIGLAVRFFNVTTAAGVDRTFSRMGRTLMPSVFALN